MKTNQEVRKELKPLFDKIETFGIRDFDLVYVLRNADEWETLKEYLRRSAGFKVHTASVSGEPEEYPCLASADYIDGDCRRDALYFEIVYLDDLLEAIYILKTTPAERKAVRAE